MPTRVFEVSNCIGHSILPGFEGLDLVGCIDRKSSYMREARQSLPPRYVHGCYQCWCIICCKDDWYVVLPFTCGFILNTLLFLILVGLKVVCVQCFSFVLVIASITKVAEQWTNLCSSSRSCSFALISCAECPTVYGSRTRQRSTNLKSRVM